MNASRSHRPTTVAEEGSAMTRMFETPNPTLLEEFGGRLRQERRALLRAIATNDEELATLEAHQVGARAEEAATTVATSIVSRLEARERQELDELEQALVRLEYGTFGLCERCEEQIPLRRLRAVPTARCCLACQKKREAPSNA
jgi:DnaK suppressor protein